MSKTRLPSLFRNLVKLTFASHTEVYTIPEIEIPEMSKGSPFISMNPPFSKIPLLLKSMYKLHLDLGRPLYLDSTQSSTFNSLLQIVSPYFQLLIPTSLHSLASTHSWISINQLETTLNPENLFLLKHIIYHFRMLFRSTDIYTSEENSKALWKKIIEMLIPVNMRCNNHFPLIDSFNDPDGEMYVAYFSSDNIYLSTLKSQISSLCYFNGLQNDSGSYTISFVYKDNLIIDTFNTNKYEMWSDYTSKSVSSRNNVVQYICSSFSSIPSNVQLTPEFIDAYQKMILTHDMTFIIPFFQCILESPKSKELARSLCDIYSKNNSIFILFKMIAYFEISFFASTPTEIFRQNTVFTQLITDFFKLKLKKFIENGINVVKTEVSKRPLFDFDHPKEEDIQIIEELLDIFWRVMDSSISYIPKSILQFLRYLRMLCETKFGDENLNHRALIGVFLLRFIVPSFSSPENNMVNGTIDQNSFRRSIAFSKVIMSLSTLEMNYTRVGDRQFLNPIFEKHIPKMALFLQKISEVDEDEVMEDIDENRNVDIKDAINEIREFIRENRKEIEKRAEKVGSLPPLFLVEAMFSLFDTAVSE